MAASKSFYARSSYRFLSVERDDSIGTDSVFELDESDVWNSTRSSSPEFRKPAKKPTKKTSKVADSSDPDRVAPSSLPVNIPDWSKILREECRESNRRRENDDDFYGEDEDCDVANRLPPHEFLARQFARTRIASFSVHEGIGRTLKGRDLRRVRNAIWEKTGFED